MTASARRPDTAKEAVGIPIRQLRAGAHSDYGFLTILKSEDSTGGLQVRNRDGEWADVLTVEGAFIVIIGDAMMRWTDDQWASIVHRVVNPPDHGRAGSRRQSIPFFHNANADAVIECFDASRDADRPAKCDPVTYGEYADLKYGQRHGVS